jgi:hypothetical protein
VWRFVRYAWAAPNSVVGLALAALALRAGRVEVVDGCVEAHGPLLSWLLTHLSVLPRGIAAITLGHVVLARDAQAMVATRQHERVHVRQYERWGPLFVPAYCAASLWAVARGRHPYRDNRFESDARRGDVR